MRFTRMFILAVVGTLLTYGCDGLSAYMARAEAGRSKCSMMEGNPDCVDGQKIDPIVYEPGEDRSNIRDLQARYESAVEDGDSGGLIALFAENAVLEGRGVRIEGRLAIGTALSQDRSASVLFQAPHVVTNVVISIDGLSATSKSSWFELDKDKSTGHLQVGRHGLYEDQFIKVERTWFFVKRKIVVV